MTGYGVYAFANADAGGTMTTSYGVLGEGRGGTTRYGVYGHGRTNPGTNSNGTVHYGVYGFASNGTQNNYGVYGTATGAGSFSAYFNGTAVQNAGFWTCSDREFKTDIKEIEGAMALVARLAPKSYLFDRSVHAGFNLPDGRQFGLISQEVESVLPELVHVVHHPETFDADGKLLEAGFDYKAMDYQALIPILIAAHQEQQAIIQDKQEQIDVLNDRLQRIEQLLANNSSRSDPGVAVRNQNMLSVAPNPFSDRTTITYSVSCECRVQLQVTGRDGKAIAVLVDSRLSEGVYTYDWNTADIAAGVYTCTLLVDGQPATEQAVKVAR
ncbi:MAG: tail fiber domain-containing protein [Flavobacteriales bacterium]|nr:tail fiber domain-containing protein [Flavobacteriales bacterium]